VTYSRLVHRATSRLGDIALERHHGGIDMLWTALATLSALILYFVLGINVARARTRYRIPAPAIHGDPAFERVFRVQQNTVETLVLFLPALWLFAWYVSDVWAALLGAVWIAVRAWYAKGYYADAAKRGPGFGVAAMATMILLIGSATGIVRGLVWG
jgi:glutathione S-transferase